MSKRTIVDQKMCDMVRMMMAGKPKIKTVADMLGVGASTIQRIQAAGFDAQKYKQLTGERKAKERQDKEPAAEVTAQEDVREQVPGQMKMDLQTEEEGAKEMAEYLHCEDAPVKKVEILSFMRLFAGKTDLLSQFLAELGAKMDKIIDNQAQILRRMDK